MLARTCVHARTHVHTRKHVHPCIHIHTHHHGNSQTCPETQHKDKQQYDAPCCWLIQLSRKWKIHWRYAKQLKLACIPQQSNCFSFCFVLINGIIIQDNQQQFAHTSVEIYFGGSEFQIKICNSFRSKDLLQNEPGEEMDFYFLFLVSFWEVTLQ